MSNACSCRPRSKLHPTAAMQYAMPEQGGGEATPLYNPSLVLPARRRTVLLSAPRTYAMGGACHRLSQRMCLENPQCSLQGRPLTHTHTHTHRQMPWQRKRAIQHGVRDICNGEVGHGYGIKHGPEAIVPLSAVPWRSRHARTCTTVARAGDHRSAGERHVVPHGRGDERGHNIKHSSHYGLHHPHSHPQGCQQRHNSPGGAQQTIPIPHPGCQWQVVDQRQPQRHHPP